MHGIGSFLSNFPQLHQGSGEVGLSFDCKSLSCGSYPVSVHQVSGLLLTPFILVGLPAASAPLDLELKILVVVVCKVLLDLAFLLHEMLLDLLPVNTIRPDIALLDPVVELLELWVVFNHFSVSNHNQLSELLLYLSYSLLL